MLVIKFRIGGRLRFLSHAETVRVFQRSCVRAGIKTAYSQGFNPRPRLSLPLPRSVGVESDDELLCLRVSNEASSGDIDIDTERFKTMLSEQLPDGCEILSVGVAKAKTSFRPDAATYILAVRQQYLNENLKTRIKRLLAETTLKVERQAWPKKPNFKNVDVRPFLKSIRLDDRGVVVECEISPAGSIRIDEILKLLELDAGMLAGPIRRSNVQWEKDGLPR